MTDETPRALSVSEGARRAFLAEVERSLAARRVPGLTLEYRAVMPPPVLRHAPRTILVAGLSGAPGEVRVAAVTATRHVATTRPGSGGAALEQVRAYARSMGVAAVAGTYRTHEPFPGEGTLEYEVTIVEPSPRSE